MPTRGSGSSSRTWKSPPAVSAVAPMHHRVTKGSRGWHRRNRSIGRHSTGRAFPRGVIAQRYAPQFASSQAVIWVSRWPRPLGRTAILMRTRKRRSAIVISRGLPGIMFLLTLNVQRRSRPLISTFPSSVNWRRRSFRSAILSNRARWGEYASTGRSGVGRSGSRRRARAAEPGRCRVILRSRR